MREEEEREEQHFRESVTRICPAIVHFRMAGLKR
jgi:hypothetical protein